MSSFNENFCHKNETKKKTKQQININDIWSIVSSIWIDISNEVMRWLARHNGIVKFKPIKICQESKVR